MVRLRFAASLVTVLAFAFSYISAATRHAADARASSRPLLSSPAGDTAEVRVMFLVDELPVEVLEAAPKTKIGSLGLWLDGERVSFEDEFVRGAVSKYVTTAPGEFEIAIAVDGIDRTFSPQRVSIAATSYTVVMTGSAEGFGLEAVKDSLGILEDNKAGAVLVNVSTEDLWLTGFGSALFDTERLRPGLVSARYDLRAGKRLINVGASPSETSFSFKLRSLPKSAQLVIFHGDSDVYVLGHGSLGVVRPAAKAGI